MKRDMDLVRKLLLVIDNSDGSESPHDLLNQTGHSYEKAIHHLHIMAKRGLVDATVVETTDKSSKGRRTYVPGVIGHLTWEGYDFLDNIRSETVWNQTKEKVSKTVGSASLEIVKEVAAAVIRQMIFPMGS